MATYQEQIEKLRIAREAREKVEAENKARQLSPEQIKNWRQVLVQVVGPFALIMPESMVHDLRDLYQKRIDQLVEKK